jgi:hypothetical protein
VKLLRAKVREREKLHVDSKLLRKKNQPRPSCTCSPERSPRTTHSMACRLRMSSCARSMIDSAVPRACGVCGTGSRYGVFACRRSLLLLSGRCMVILAVDLRVYLASWAVSKHSYFDSVEHGSPR